MGYESRVNFIILSFMHFTGHKRFYGDPEDTVQPLSPLKVGILKLNNIIQINNQYVFNINYFFKYVEVIICKY